MNGPDSHDFLRGTGDDRRLKSVGRISGEIIHDFNNVLSLIVGYSEYLSSELPPEHPALQNAQHIREAAERGGTLIRELFAFARSTSSDSNPFDLNALIRRLETMLCLLVEESISLRILLDPALGPVKAEGGEIERLIFDLMLHARAAMPKGGTLIIQTSKVVLGPEHGRTRNPALQALPQGSYVVIAVQDTTGGVLTEGKTGEFRSFTATENFHPGEDILLREIYEIVEKNQGAIESSSSAEARADFKIYLPMSAQTASSARAAAR
jgi:signal transduction histidine kinase